MCQVGQPHQPEYQRKAGREQEQQTAERKAVETLDDPKLHRRPILLLKAVRSLTVGAAGLWLQVLGGRIIARVDGVLQEGGFVVGPELADIRIGLDDRVDQPSVRLADL